MKKKLVFFMVMATTMVSTLTSCDVPTTVLINAAEGHQTMAGFGNEERLFDDPHMFNNFDPTTGRAATVMTPAQQDQIYTELYTNLGLTRVRPIPDTPIEAVQGGPYDFSWKHGDGHMAYVAKALAHGATTGWYGPLYMEDWFRNSPRDPAAYLAWIMPILRHWRDMGLEPPYYSVIDEPGYAATPPYSAEMMRDIIKLLGPQLRREGFKTMIVTPEDVDSSQAADRATIILADPAARQYVGAIATHLYDGWPWAGLLRLKALSAEYSIPLWMTEYSLFGMGPQETDAMKWGLLMQELISKDDFSAVDYIWGAFGRWDGYNGNTALISLLHNPDNSYAGYTLNKQYFVTGQYSRFVRPGAVRVTAGTSDPQILVSAFRQPGQLVIVAHSNDWVNSHSATFGFAGVSPKGNAAIVVRTSDTENWASIASPNIGPTSFTATLTPRSITTFVLPTA